MIIKNKVYQITARIPRGKVATYGLIAKLAGCKSARTVGNMLHLNLDPTKIPCYRVVTNHGKLARRFAFGGISEQRKRLEAEGVFVKGDKIDLDRYLWLPK